MSKSLAELRAEAKPRPMERAYNLCLAQDLVARVQVLGEEKQALALEVGIDDAASSDDEDEKPKKPRRAADPRTARIKEIDTELEALYEQMREHSGEVVLRARPAGEWQQWVTKNPARFSDQQDENGRAQILSIDEQVAYGMCSAAALLDDLKRYVASWNGEDVTAEDYRYLIDNAAPGDVKEMCRIVVQMHEAVGARAPKASSTSSSATGRRATS